MTIMTFFSYVGGFATAWATCAIGSVLFAVAKSSDVRTALTPKLPKTAFQGMVVWITGGSSGIGREMALLLAERGVKIIISSRSKKDLETVAQECRDRNADVRVAVLPLDLNAKQSLAAKAKEAIKLFGALDIMINNGGVSTRVMATDCSVESDEFLTQVDYLAHVALTKAVLPAMLELKSSGRIINTLSVCSKIGVPSRTAYCGAKFALKGWMDALRSECILRENSLHILNACIGSTNTPLPFRAVTNVSADGKVETFKQKDDNISKGMSPTFVAERMLSTSYHKSVNECWLAKGKELVLLYVNQFLPATAFNLMVKSAGKQYAVHKDKAKGE